MNKAILAGRLTKDPVVRYTQTGLCVTSFTLAINKKFGKEALADFIPVVVWDKMAEVCGQYLQKGSKVLVEGRIQTRSYEKDGVKHYVTEVIAGDIEFMGKKPEAVETPPEQKAFGEEVPPDEEIPF